MITKLLASEIMHTWLKVIKHDYQIMYCSQASVLYPAVINNTTDKLMMDMEIC